MVAFSSFQPWDRWISDSVPVPIARTAIFHNAPLEFRTSSGRYLAKAKHRITRWIDSHTLADPRVLEAVRDVYRALSSRGLNKSMFP
jgi:hypothetical protein